MKIRTGFAICAVLLLATLAFSQSIELVATGLNNPRGLKFGPDGNLYVAEGGAAGDLSTIGECEQAAGAGPYTGGFTSRISRIDKDGTRTTVIDGLPSSATNPQIGGFISGVADVAFIGKTLYAIEAGAGCSHGLAGTTNGVFKVNPNGTWTLVADLSAFQKSHPVAHPEEDDFEPDGTWYSMIAVRGSLYAVEPNHGEIDRVTTSGKISRVIDISASQGHVVPTALAYHGNFYFGNLNTFPIAPGSSKVWKVTPSGSIKTKATGFTTVLGLVFDRRGRMYVLENTTVAGFPTPNTGDIIRVDPDGSKHLVVAGLFLPTGMTIGPDGKLYVSNVGFGPPPIGLGEVIRVTPPAY
jgi:hypothetical protein